MWLLFGLISEIAVFAQNLGEAQGGTLSINAGGIEALGANPAGILQGVGKWEFSLPAFSAEMSGMTLSEYVFYFGGVRTATGWRPRRLQERERVELAHLLETRPIAFHVRGDVVAGVWHPTEDYAFGIAFGTDTWLRFQLPVGITSAAQQSVIGADTLELRGGLFSARLYSTITATYARTLWRFPASDDTASPWRWSTIAGGIAVHFYRGHLYAEPYVHGLVRLYPFVPPLWDSTVNWEVTAVQTWRLIGFDASWTALLGVAPTAGWGLGVSVGAHWSWRSADTVETALIGISLEQLGFVRWNVRELQLQVEQDTMTGIIGADQEQVRERYTPDRRSVTVTEGMPVRFRLGGALELERLGVGFPLRLSVECGYGAGKSWSLGGLQGGVGVLWHLPNPWLPWIGLGWAWGQQMAPRGTMGLRWSPPLGGFRIAVELTTGSLLGWIFREEVRSTAVGARLRMWL